MLLHALLAMTLTDAGVLPIDGGLPPMGEYWVQRRAHEALRSFENGETRHRFGARCERLVVAPRALQLGDVRFSLKYDGGIGGPQLEAPWRPAMRAQGSCSAVFPSARLWRDERECVSARPDAFERRCTQDGGCTWNAQPFELDACEQELIALHTRLAAVNQTTHAEALRTLGSLERVLDGGGTLFMERGGVCVQVQVAPRKAGVTAMKASVEGGVWSLRGSVEALFGVAHELSEAFEGPRGGGGSAGSDEPVLIGRGRFFLGPRSFWFSRRDCLAAR